jgi:outer membrane lipoprotein carrier protein
MGLRIAILSIFVAIFTPLSYLAAQGTTAKPETSDPKARAILDKVKKLYEGYQSLETGFSLTIKLAEQPKEEVQKGKMYQQGDKFRAEMNNHVIFGDNTTIWHKEGNRVNIMNASKKSTDGFMSPKDLLNISQSKEYIYALYGETADGWSKKAMIINFKPVNRRSEYTQIRVAIDSKTNQIVSATAFGRDQSRTKLAFDAPVVNKKYTADFFVFDKSKYPNIKVEDLRTD